MSKAIFKAYHISKLFYMFSKTYFQNMFTKKIKKKIGRPYDISPIGRHTFIFESQTVITVLKAIGHMFSRLRCP